MSSGFPAAAAGGLIVSTTLKKEHTCEGCNGTGFPVVKQPTQPGRKIYPPRCEACNGKGRITAGGN